VRIFLFAHFIVGLSSSAVVFAESNESYIDSYAELSPEEQIEARMVTIKALAEKHEYWKFASTAHALVADIRMTVRNDRRLQLSVHRRLLRMAITLIENTPQKSRNLTAITIGDRLFPVIECGDATLLTRLVNLMGTFEDNGRGTSSFISLIVHIGKNLPQEQRIAFLEATTAKVLEHVSLAIEHFNFVVSNKDNVMFRSQLVEQQATLIKLRQKYLALGAAQEYSLDAQLTFGIINEHRELLAKLDHHNQNQINDALSRLAAMDYFPLDADTIQHLLDLYSESAKSHNSDARDYISAIFEKHLLHYMNAEFKNSTPERRLLFAMHCAHTFH
jgi:hypothetical protein